MYTNFEEKFIEKALTLSYNVHLLGQIFELRHSPSSGTKTNENVEKDAKKKRYHRSNEAMKTMIDQDREKIQ